MIDMSEGNIYQVLARQDKQGNPDWWLIQSDSNTGYVPKNYIKLLN